MSLARVVIGNNFRRLAEGEADDFDMLYLLGTASRC
jgi:hypothetical protein